MFQWFVTAAVGGFVGAALWKAAGTFAVWVKDKIAGVL